MAKVELGMTVFFPGWEVLTKDSDRVSRRPQGVSSSPDPATLHRHPRLLVRLHLRVHRVPLFYGDVRLARLRPLVIAHDPRRRHRFDQARCATVTDRQSPLEQAHAAALRLQY